MNEGKHNDQPIIDASKVTITGGDPETDLGLVGTVNDHPAYRFSAKVFDRGSEFGIEDGRISKLHVWNNDTGVFDYSRGWGDRPRTSEHFEVLLKQLDDVELGSSELLQCSSFMRQAVSELHQDVEAVFDDRAQSFSLAINPASHRGL